MLKQLESKPGKYIKFKKLNAPKERSCGKATISCKRCGSHRGMISKYHLYLCRRCFREIATRIGFKKFN
ncbi:30S ribosomal protein S14 [Candidatus Woesearchaeota archaeon]|nr:MAG: 30S ribosomal protein S14 [Candidatus Woesearchaeota archaeon]